MNDAAAILKKLDKQDERLERIESTITVLAAQAVKITNLQHQVSALWKKQDLLTSPDGMLSNIAKHQASCPRKQFPRIWWALGLLYTSMLGVILKVMS